MRVLILAPGGRGDTQPFVALGKKLIENGHDVVFACPYQWSEFAESYGLDTVPLKCWSGAAKKTSTRRVLTAPIFRNSRVLSFMLNLRRIAKLNEVKFKELAKIDARGVDLIVHHVFIPGHAMAEVAGIPAVPVTLVPCWVPTQAFPNPWLPFVPKIFNRVSYKICLPRWISELGTTRWRRQVLSVPAWRGHRNVIRRPGGRSATVLQALSRSMLPSDLDYPDNVHTTGYWFLSAETDWTPSESLVNFLAAGSRPICICFGSAVGADARRSAHIITDAVRLAGVRAIVVGGAGGIAPEASGDEIYYADQIPFDWLLPQTATVVHHGGMGTAGLALVAGRPQVVCPFHPGQRFTAQRLQALGVAGDPLPQRQLTAEALAGAIQETVNDHSKANAAMRVSPEIRNEQGLETAIKILESLA